MKMDKEAYVARKYLYLQERTSTDTYRHRPRLAATVHKCRNFIPRWPPDLHISRRSAYSLNVCAGTGRLRNDTVLVPVRAGQLLVRVCTPL